MKLITIRCPSCEQVWDSDVSLCGTGPVGWKIETIAKALLSVHQSSGFPIPCERAPEFVDYR